MPANHLQLVHAVDLVPTILSAVELDAQVTSRMPGRNLMRSACGAVPLEDQAVFGAIYPNDAEVLGAPARHVRGRWMREGDFKLIVPGQGKNPLPPALFDLKADPGEQNNLATHFEYADRLENMQQSLDQWWSGHDDGRVTQYGDHK